MEGENKYRVKNKTLPITGFIISTIIIVGLLAGFNFAIAVWSEPTATPPDQNITAPINSGPDPQTIGGDLMIDGNLEVTSITDVININVDGALCFLDGTCQTTWDDVIGLWNESGVQANAIFYNAGNVGIGTDDPERKLHVSMGDVSEYSHFNDPLETYGFIMSRSRGTAISPTQVQSGDSLGLIYAMGYDGSDYEMASGLLFRVDGTTGLNQMPGRIEFRTNPGDGTKPVRMVIKSDGRVGINTPDPGATLDVSGQSIFGNASEVVTSPENLIYGNMDVVSDGNLFLLQKESADMFSIDSDGSVSVINNLNLVDAKSIIIPKDDHSGIFVANYNDDQSGFCYLGEDCGGTTNYAAGIYVEGSVKAGELCLGDSDCKATWGEIAGNLWQPTADFATTGNIYYDSALIGSVGIGTATPGAALGEQLDIRTNSDTNATIRIDADAAENKQAGIIFDNDDGLAYIGILGGLTPGELTINNLNDIVFRINNIRAMTIDEDQDVGIGTDNPNQKLHIVGGNLRIEHINTTLAAVQLDNSGGTGMNIEYGRAGSENTLGIYSNDLNENVVTIQNSDGFVGIGTPTPNAELEVAGQAMFGGASEVVAPGQNLIYGNIDTTSAGNLLLLQKESADRFSVDSAGSVSISNNLNLVDAKSVIIPKVGHSGIFIANYDDDQSGFCYLGEDCGGTTNYAAGIFVEGSVKAGEICLGDSDCKATWGDIAGNLWTLSGTDLFPNNLTWNVGIGTASPLQKLSIDVGGTGDQGIIRVGLGQIDGTARDFIIEKDTSSPWGSKIIWAANSTVDGGFLAFHASDQASGEKMRITSSGEVGIGTVSPTSTLNVLGDANITENIRIGGALDIYGVANAYGTMGVFGSLFVNGIMTVSQDSDLWGNLDVALDFSVDRYSMFGDGMLNMGASENLIYGNVNLASLGNLLLLQTSGSDRFSVDPSGNVGLSGDIQMFDAKSVSITRPDGYGVFDRSGIFIADFNDTAGEFCYVNPDLNDPGSNCFGDIYSADVYVEGKVSANEFCIGNTDCKEDWGAIAGNLWTLNGTDLYPNDLGWSVGIGINDPKAKLEVYNTAITSDGDGSATDIFSGQDSIVLYGHGGVDEGTYGSITWAVGGRRRAMMTTVAENTDTDYVGLAFYTQGTDGPGDMYESMRISHSGFVGIGVDVPLSNDKLRVDGQIRASGNILAESNVYAGSDGSAGGSFSFGNTTGQGEYIDRVNDDVSHYAGGFRVLTLDGDVGNLGIRNGTPGYPLHITDNDNTSIVRIDNLGTDLWTGTSLARDGNERWFVGMNNTSDDLFFRRNETTNDMYIDSATGNVYVNGELICLEDGTNCGGAGDGYIGTGTDHTSSGNLTMDGDLMRTTHSNGFLVGSYNNVGANSTKSNPIYTIGSNYKPTDDALSNMYGIGYSHSNFWGTDTNKPTGWGQYVAANGVIRIILEANNGRIWASGDVRAPIFYDTNNMNYYVNPAGTSVVNTLTVNTDIYANALYGRSPVATPENIWLGDDNDTIMIQGDLDVDGTIETSALKMNALNDKIYVNNSTNHFIQPETSDGDVNMASIGDVTVNIDSDNDSGGHFFGIYNNATDETGTELFRVQENGDVLVGGVSVCLEDGTNCTGVGDNLGNHIATQNIQLNTRWLSNDGDNEGVRVDNAGKVGINEPSPSAQLDIVPSSGITLELGRITGNPSIKSSESYLIMDSNGGYTSINHYVTDNVILSSGGGRVGIDYTNPAAKLDIDTGSNVSGIRLRGASEGTEIADIYVGSSGELKLTTENNVSEPYAYIELDAADDGYGLILRDSADGGSSVFSNFYMTNAATDYLNIVVGQTTATAGLVIDANQNIGIGTKSIGGYKLNVSGTAYVSGSITADDTIYANAGIIAAGGQITSTLDMDGNRIANLANLTGSSPGTDAANKAYVDAQVGGGDGYIGNAGNHVAGGNLDMDVYYIFDSNSDNVTISDGLNINTTVNDALNFTDNSTNDNRGISFNNRTALSADYNDGWLRLNNLSEFANGVYSAGNLQIGGAVQINDGDIVANKSDTASWLALTGLGGTYHYSGVQLKSSTGNIWIMSHRKDRPNSLLFAYSPDGVTGWISPLEINPAGNVIMDGDVIASNNQTHFGNHGDVWGHGDGTIAPISAGTPCFWTDWHIYGVICPDGYLMAGLDSDEGTIVGDAYERIFCCPL